jgi:hypothetical protein
VSVRSAWLSTRINTSTTTTVKSGAGTFHSIVVGGKGSSASTVTVYDNTAGSGTVLALIDSLNQVGTYLYDIAFGTGLTVVTTGAADMVVTYR